MVSGDHVCMGMDFYIPLVGPANIQRLLGPQLTVEKNALNDWYPFYSNNMKKHLLMRTWKKSYVGILYDVAMNGVLP